MVITWASIRSSARRCISSAAACMKPARSAEGVLAQPSNARRAAATAASTSARFPLGTRAQGFSVAGLITSIVSVLWGAAQRPFMKSLSNCFMRCPLSTHRRSGMKPGLGRPLGKKGSGVKGSSAHTACQSLYARQFPKSHKMGIPEGQIERAAKYARFVLADIRFPAGHGRAIHRRRSLEYFCLNLSRAIFLTERWRPTSLFYGPPSAGRAARGPPARQTRPRPEKWKPGRRRAIKPRQPHWRSGAQGR